MVTLGQFSNMVADATLDALNGVQRGEVRDLGQFEEQVSKSIMAAIDRFGPDIASKLQAWIEPATQKAVETAKPVVQQLLKDYLPVFAGIVGLFTAGAILLGIGIAKKTYERQRRNPDEPGESLLRKIPAPLIFWGVKQVIKAKAPEIAQKFDGMAGSYVGLNGVHRYN